MVSSSGILQDRATSLELWVSCGPVPPEILGKPSIFNYTFQNEILELEILLKVSGCIPYSIAMTLQSTDLSFIRKHTKNPGGNDWRTSQPL